jgi:hypothetical protein
MLEKRKQIFGIGGYQAGKKTTTLPIMNLLTMKILIMLNTGNITYDEITHN